MYCRALGTDLVKFNPIYTVCDRPNTNLHKPTGQPVIRWHFYENLFKNICPLVR